MWEILYKNPLTCEWEHLIYTKVIRTVRRFENRGYRIIALAK